MVQKKMEETPSESSYEQFNPSTGSVDDVSSAVVSEDDEENQSTCLTSGSRNSGVRSLHPDKEGESKSVSWKKDETFFFSFVTFRVEERLFRVPRGAFENQSQYFRDLFASKAPTSGANITGDINEPIYLEAVEDDAFRDFLRLLYPPPTSSSFTGPIVLSRKQWIKVLDLGQKWGFTGIRAYAIEKLEAIDLEAVEKLELALKYEIQQWYNDAYLALCKRPRPLSSDEGRRLGLDLSLKIAEVRERRLARSTEESSKTPVTTNVTNIPSAFLPPPPKTGSRRPPIPTNLEAVAKASIAESSAMFAQTSMARSDPKRATPAPWIWYSPCLPQDFGKFGPVPFTAPPVRHGGNGPVTSTNKTPEPSAQDMNDRSEKGIEVDRKNSTLASDDDLLRQDIKEVFGL